MKKIIILLSAFAIASHSFAQDKIVQGIKKDVVKSDIEAHITFLASDDMRGRDTGSPEAAIAANYLAAHYALFGLKKVPGMTSYFQEVGLEKTQPAKTADLKIGNDLFKLGTDIIVLKGKSFGYSGDLLFIGYGNEADYAGINVKGKVVVSYAGSSDKSTLRSAFGGESKAKYDLAKEKGAVGMIEIVSWNEIPWERLSGFFTRGSIALSSAEGDDNVIPHFWLRKSASPVLTTLIDTKKVEGIIALEKPASKVVPGKNVIGLIEGTDAKLKEEYIVLSAHYDHVGVRKNGTADSIYNGARDNALGTSAILEAAKFLAKHPSKRSYLIIGYTGEEKGLLGSQWYAAHPVIPLNKTVYNLDCDGAGYNDKTIVSLIDLNRTSVDDLLKKAVAAFGLTLTGDPAPEENLYERSDNYNFAVKGVPAVDFAPGIKTFDEELNKYYHQAADEVSTLDFEYLEKYIRSYVYASALIGNSPTKPTWKAGDKFEAEGKKLYGGGK